MHAEIRGRTPDRGGRTTHFVTFGVNKGDKFGEYNEEDYANRLCMAIDRERRAACDVRAEI